MKDEKVEKKVKDLIEAMEKDRGYLQAAWRYLATKDVDFMEAYNNLYGAGLNAGKALPVKVRELIAIGILAFRGNDGGVYEHMKRALKHGATKQELIEALETAMIPGGAPILGVGLKALMRIEEEEAKGK
jgi:AhpD family alkylhydroperoxidase